ncbi:hypothetical protein LBMAG42_27910 [Deltaproteobacteria bacterium]|nr:hypothetical protein LBMAG42_27910 [Deltaproteobacteria bacterium]
MIPFVLEITSTAFTPGAPSPAKYTCTAENLSPPLAWGAPPAGTASFVLIFDDPDAPGRVWNHWLVWNLPVSSRGLPEGTRPDAAGMVQGTNDFGEIGYGGPCPPPGHGTHRYFARLYAVDRNLPLTVGASRVEVDAQLKGHVLASSELMGKFWR